MSEELEEKDFLPACKPLPRVWRKILPADTAPNHPCQGTTASPHVQPRNLPSQACSVFKEKLWITFKTDSRKNLTLSRMLTSDPFASNSFTSSICLYSVAQIIGVQPPSSWGAKGKCETCRTDQMFSCWIYKPLGSHSRVHLAWEPQILSLPTSVSSLSFCHATAGRGPSGPAEPSVIRANSPQQAGVYLQLSRLAMDLQGVQT